MNEPSRIITPDPLPKREMTVISPVNPDATPMQMLAIMTQRGVSMSDLKDLVALAKDWEANQARKAYVAAMTLFKAEPHEILKTKFVDIEGGAKFFHATLADVVDGVVASLAKFGLSHKWITDQSNPQQIKVTCVITHRDGHSESTEMVGGPDTTGRKNPIQQVASAQTLMQRYTLLSLCGLASKDMDDEAQLAAKSGRKPPPPEPEGYDNWALNVEAVAEEGTKRLQETWKASSEVFRNHTVKWESDWWARMKTKAAKVQS
jgi:hypothetical protein